MSLSLYIDENVQIAITLGLRSRGIDVLTVQEDDRTGVPDLEVLDRAIELQRVVFTRDRDFLVEASRRQAEGIPFGGVLYGHQLLVSIGECIRDLEIIAKLSEPEELASRVEFLPL